jgi:tetratricopeptide (TPR) repeat protein
MPVFLRDSRSEDPAFWEAYGEGRAELERVRMRGDAQILLRMLGSLGTYARLLQRYAESVDLLQEALTLSQELHLPAFEAANLIRLGTSYQYAGQNQAAEHYFIEALNLTEDPEASAYRDFAWQHLGKLLAEEGLFNEARGCFLAALQLRQDKGDADLLASTQAALTALDALMAAGRTDLDVF